ncbi:N-acetylmuramoyl-L-alanine amidase [uncultured Tyzzerella sp.]|uniref:N-acetylmuramoyl-L-alanine amidase n=1 Tax=uncultured Tyzzerella sp. TaxID=2321398 RepID=UPI00294247BC|nr:N-acetylmuramoyl-L-alanine amidase [uncultured Tyzzerella sp.]
MFKQKNFLLVFFTMIFVLMINICTFSAPYVNFKITYDNKTYTYNKERVYLYVNSKKVEDLPLEPIIINNYTLVPARESFEKIGASVTWIKDKEQVQVVYKDMVVLMKINDVNATVNGQLFKMSIPPKLINSKTMIPVRFVSEAMGLDVVWKNDERIIDIKEKILQDTTTETTTLETTTISNPQINIEGINMPDSDERTFSIYSNKKIEKFEQVILDNGAVAIDIYNSKNNINQTSIDSITEFISNVTIENKDNNITRFIFKTKSSVLNNNFLSEDGKTLYVNFGGNPIKKLDMYNDGVNDILKIYGEFAPDVNITKNEAKDRLNIEIKNAALVGLTENIQKTKYINNLDYSKSTGVNINIEATLNEDIKFSHKKQENTTVITIYKEENNSNIDTNNELNSNITSNRQFKIEKKSSVPININNIKHTDNYLNKEYILTFDTDITPLINIGEHRVDNELVNKITVENVSNRTQMIIDCKKITAINVTEDINYIYINMLLPKEKYKNVVVVDPGHGGEAPGTTGNGLVEKDINLDISLILNQLFEQNHNIKAYFTRLEDVNPSFNDRTNMSNEVGDMFVSIHQNASGKGEPGPNGTEVYYLNPNTNDTGLTSKDMADILQKNLLKELGTLDRKVKTSNLIVLRNNKIPAVLCEIGFLSNPAEAARISTPEFKQKAAKAIYDGILEITEKFPSKR